ncbi:DNA N-6-adenine-methyltransferase [Nocardia flavorosea]|uniref:Adenine methyltransferase n=1 Tax=Nocardia flavorosea TaxID=53429 RepID=A0A846YNT8_9NOCA|nr:DNA N-6-adenine-methyltransferase [Nocardia flavorosea]NKY60787.1 adenine methyltransferase [Nocardia flavorosea]
MTTGRAIGGHHSARSGSNVWLTPPGIIGALGVFDLDPCAADPRPWDTARRHIAPPEDGLSAEWVGRVFLNPPYTGLPVWLGKLADHGQGTALVFARTETRWFVDLVWRRATAVLFLHGRLHFHLPDGARAQGNAGAPSVLVAYGERDAELLAGCGLDGTFLRVCGKGSEGAA